MNVANPHTPERLPLADLNRDGRVSKRELLFVGTGGVVLLSAGIQVGAALALLLGACGG